MATAAGVTFASRVGIAASCNGAAVPAVRRGMGALSRTVAALVARTDGAVTLSARAPSTLTLSALAPPARDGALPDCDAGRRTLLSSANRPAASRVLAKPVAYTANTAAEPSATRLFVVCLLCLLERGAPDMSRIRKRGEEGEGDVRVRLSDNNRSAGSGELESLECYPTVTVPVWDSLRAASSADTGTPAPRNTTGYAYARHVRVRARPPSGP